MYRGVFLFLLTLVSICSFGQFNNKKIDEQTSPDNLLSSSAIAINPRNPLNIVAAAHEDNIYVSNDGGVNWEKKKIESPYGVYGDPVLVADNKGVFFHFHLADPTGEGRNNEKSLDQIVCHLSYDGGKTWDAGNPIGYNPPKDQDRPWAATDTKGNIYVTWTQFDKYLGADSACQSLILLSSSPSGKKWSKPITISQQPGNCLDDDAAVAGGVPAVGDDKKMYVLWARNNKLYLDRSFDGGNMWLSTDVEVTDQYGGWNLTVPGYERCNGLPSLLIDKSKSERKGLLYLLWSDQKNGADNTDIWFLRSNNFGDYWTPPVKVNTDTGRKHQYMPSMAVDNTTGYLYVLFYDRREHNDNKTDVYLAYSTDSGTSFKNIKISETPFTPDAPASFGGQLQVSAHKGIVAAVWTRMDEGTTSIWTSVFRHDQLPK